MTRTLYALALLAACTLPAGAADEMRYGIQFYASLPADPDAPLEVPDNVLTPGVVATADEDEVCGIVGGLTYSKRHRATTSEMKAEVFRRYGMPVPPASDRDEWEIDHLIPLCLAGSDVVENLWPQYREGTWGFPVKDRLEAEACREVCHGHTPLAEAQGWFMRDWRVSYCAVFADDPRCGQISMGDRAMMKQEPLMRAVPDGRSP